MSGSTISAFSESQASRLTGLSIGQLRYWTKTEFFNPSAVDDERPSERVYSYLDVVALRLLAALRKKYDVSLQHLRDIQRHVHDDEQSRWAGKKLYVLKKRVHIDDGDGPVDALSGQQVLGIVEISPVVASLDKKINGLTRRSPSDIGRIEQVQGIARRQPVIAGTRIPIAAIKEFRDAGYSVSAILKEYPTLKRADIQAALVEADAA